MLTPTPSLFTPSTSTPTETGQRWYVLRTRSRQEMILSNELRSMGLSHCLPLVGRRRRFGACDAAVRVPLFSQCLFLRGTPLDAEFATRTSRVTGLLEVPDAARLASELQDVCRAADSGARCEVVPLPDSGPPAHVTRGPLSGVAGLLHHTDSACKLLLPLTCIAQAVAVEIDPSCVQRRN